jgi:hypothetical protein
VTPRKVFVMCVSVCGSVEVKEQRVDFCNFNFSSTTVNTGIDITILVC